MTTSYNVGLLQVAHEAPSHMGTAALVLSVGGASARLLVGVTAGTNTAGDGVSESNLVLAAIHNMGKPAASHVLPTALGSVDCPAFRS